MSTRGRIVLAALVAATLLGEEASADTPTPASGATWAANQHVNYRWKAGAEPPGWLRPAIHAAAEDSNTSRASKAAVFAYGAGAQSWIGYTADIPTNYAVGYAVRRVPDSYNIRLRPHGHVLDWGTLRWCQFYENPPNGCYDAELITLHEFGHVQTLGHVDESLGEPWLDSIMHAGPRTKAKIGWNEDEFGRCDVARLQVRYRPLTPGTRYSTCLALPTALTLGASSTSITSGQSVTISAKLKVSSSTGYAKLAGEPISDRQVALQRRVPGSSSWTTHAQMPATSIEGRYASTVRPTTTYEWRALFSTPANDGLKGSSSAVIRVNVANCVEGVCCTGPICATGTESGMTNESGTQADESEGP